MYACLSGCLSGIVFAVFLCTLVGIIEHVLPPCCLVCVMCPHSCAEGQSVDAALGRAAETGVVLLRVVRDDIVEQE